MLNIVYSGGVFKQQEGQGKADLEEGVIGNQEFDRWAGYKQLGKLGLFSYPGQLNR